MQSRHSCQILLNLVSEHVRVDNQHFLFFPTLCSMQRKKFRERGADPLGTLENGGCTVPPRHRGHAGLLYDWDVTRSKTPKAFGKPRSLATASKSTRQDWLCERSPLPITQGRCDKTRHQRYLQGTWKDFKAEEVLTSARPLWKRKSRESGREDHLKRLTFACLKGVISE